MLGLFQVYSKVNQVYIHICLLAKLLHLCPTLCDPMDCSPSCSSVPGILQVRILEWVAMASSRIFLTQGWKLVSYAFCIGRLILCH